MEGLDLVGTPFGTRAQRMRMIDSLARGMLRCAITAAALAASGCALLAPEPEAPPETKPVVHEPVVIVESPQPVSKRKEPIPVAIEPEPAQLPPVAIVLTSSQPAYSDVARELTRNIENYEVYDLSDKSRPPVSVLRLINDSNSGVVVAIGLRAAQSSVAMSKKPVVFSQVFNYQDHDLLNENSRGIAATTPISAQIEAWLQIDPTITRIGAIVGEGHDDLIAEAELAAVRHKVDLRMLVTHSDQETLYFFKRIIRDIDGFLLFPDNRVLSRRALRQIMDDAKRHQVPVLAPSDSMLRIGASVSVSSVASDIAKTITDIIRQIDAGDIAQVPPISRLSEIRVTTNNAVQVVER